MAYTKSVNVAEMVRSDFPDDPYLEPDLVRYFPTRCSSEYHAQILEHRLRREIVATQIAQPDGQPVGHLVRQSDDRGDGAGVVDVMRAWVAARDIFSFPATWEQIEALPTP